MAATCGFSTTLRNARADEITTALDGGSGAGLLRLYDGSQPATGGTATTKLSENSLSDPAASGASGGVLTLDTVTDATAVASGTATWGRFVDSSGTFVADLNAGTSGAAITLNNASITSGQTVSVTSATFTEGNA